MKRLLASIALLLGSLTGHAADNLNILDKALYPTTYGTAAQCWTSNGAGVLPSWQACSGGGGGGTPGGSDTQVQFNNAGSFGGSANMTWVSPQLTIGAAGSTTGILGLTGSTSGTISILGQAAAGTYNFNLPTSSGTSGQVLTSAGGGSSPMTWSTFTPLSGSLTNGGLIRTDGTNILSTGALTGLLQGNGTSAPTAITNSSTVGQVLRTTGASTYAWGAVDLADTDAVTGVLPAANIASSITRTIASGSKALATSAISSATCTSAQTDTATGTLTTDSIIVSFNGDPTAVTGYVPLTTGMLTIIPYPTADTVNFKVCNNTGSSVTPGAITLNWRVVR